MRPEHWQQLDQLFHSALERAASERAAFLDDACADNDSLHKQVEALLAAYEEANSFIEQPALNVEARSIANDSCQLTKGQLIGHYRIISQLGAGGMGEVYLTEDTKLGRKVALKILPDALASDHQRMSRFVLEAKAASALNHPNIITIHEIDQRDSINFMAMEFVDGETLRDRMRRGQMKLSEVLDVATQAASAIAAAHAAGIVHRDIKPENIMLRRDGIVKVLDFGVAKLTPVQEAVDTEAATKSLFTTDPGIVVGTVAYMSPEQARGLQTDARTDIFSFGVMLYEMIAGCLPFNGVTAGEILGAILDEKEPPHLARFAREVPHELEHMVSKALRKNREGRYQSTTDLLIDLQDLKRELAVQAELERSGPQAGEGTATSWPAPKTSPFASRSEYILNQVKLHRLATIVSLIVIALALTATLLWYFKPTRTGPILTDKDTILLADFENKTGDEVFDRALKQGLAVQLAQSPFLSIFSDTQVQETLKKMNRSPDEHLTAEIAREICERRRLKAFITGSIVMLGSTYVLTLEVIGGSNGEVLAREQAEALGKEQVLKALAQAAAKLRESLGESLSSIEQFGAPLADSTTSSLEALRAYSIGTQRLNASELESIPFFKRAIDLDPNFALAYSVLAARYSNTGQTDLSVEYAAKAYALRDRASVFERLRIEEVYYWVVTREIDKELEVLEIMKRTYPRDSVSPTNLSDVNFYLGQYERALAEAQESIRRGGSNRAMPQVNLVRALLALNRFDEAKEAARAALQQIDNSAIHGDLYEIAFVYGDSAVMQEQLDWVKGQREEYVSFDWQAETERFRGRWQRAQEFSRRSIDLAIRGDAKDPAVSYAGNAAAFSAIFGQCVQAKRWATEALRLNASGRPSATALIGLALCGDLTGALQPADDYDKRYPKDTLFSGPWLPPVRAAAELQQGNAARAIELLEAGVSYEGGSQFWSPYLRGQAYLKLDRGAEAAGEFQKILDHRGQAPLSALYPLAHLGLARTASLTRDPEKSRKQYETFFSLWKDADTDIPILQQAKLEYRKLR